jgi:hypothetical protein
MNHLVPTFGCMKLPSVGEIERKSRALPGFFICAWHGALADLQPADFKALAQHNHYRIRTCLPDRSKKPGTVAFGPYNLNRNDRLSLQSTSLFYQWPVCPSQLNTP